MSSSFATFVLLLASPEAPFAPAFTQSESDETVRSAYQDCVALIAEDVEIGRIAAQQWALEGGGAAARHCLAVADLAAGFPRLAAVRLTELAERMPPDDVTARARINAEAALAWIDAREPAMAADAAGRALQFGSHLADVQIVAAKAYAEAERWQDAADAVTAAEEDGAATPEAYLIRARARRALLKPHDAAIDVVAALKLDPTNVDALVLRGELIQSGVDITVRRIPVDEASASRRNR